MCALVVRVSDSRQGDEAGKSPDNQLEQLHRYIDYLNSVAVEKESEQYQAIEPPYEMIGVRGKDSFDSPQFKRLKSDIQENKVDIVMATGLDRFGRSVRKFLQFFEFLQDPKHKKVDLVVTHYQIDTATPIGQLVITILMALAEMQSHQLSQKIKGTRHTKLEHGLTTGGFIGLGFVRDPDRIGIYKIDEDEAAAVRLAFSKFRETRSLSEVARFLNKNGYRTKVTKGKKGTLRGGKPFTRKTVEYMLRNWRYCNWIEEHKKNQFKDQSKLPPEQRYRRFKPPNIKDWPPPIIPEEEFLEVQAMLDGIAYTGKKPRSSESPYLLSGLVKCGFCGSEMKTDKGKGTGYYACDNKSCMGREVMNKISPLMKRNSIRAADLELAIKHFISSHVLAKPALVKDITVEANRYQNRQIPELNKEKVRQESLLNNLESQRDGILKSIDMNREDKETLRDLNLQLRVVIDGVRKQKSQIQTTVEQIESAKRTSITEAVVKNALEALASTSDVIPAHQQKEICELFVARVSVERDTIVVGLNLAGMQYFRSRYGPDSKSFDWRDDWYARRESNPKPSGP